MIISLFFFVAEMQKDKSIDANALDLDKDADAIEEFANTGKQVYVVVLGDIGRSPRMCNHAVSLATAGFDVTFVGYGGSNVSQQVRQANIQISTLPTCPRWFPRPLKAIWQFITLFCSLPWLAGPEIILMQNPPTIPTVVVAYVYACFHRHTKLVLDWHNYGYTILQMSEGNSQLVKIAHSIEAFFGPKVDAAFCVSKAMKRDLYNRWNIDATVLYDRPLSTFKPCSVDEKHNLLMRLSEQYPILADPNDRHSTCISELGPDGVAHLKSERPGLLVSSTSWTPDEDFGILFEALDLYESHCKQTPSLPDLICIITGKGPLKESYQERIANREWIHVQVIMPWLEPEDYPLMLGSADFGVCLHTSSSGVDLPMKVTFIFKKHSPMTLFVTLTLRLWTCSVVDSQWQLRNSRLYRSWSKTESMVFFLKHLYSYQIVLYNGLKTSPQCLMNVVGDPSQTTLSDFELLDGLNIGGLLPNQ